MLPETNAGHLMWHKSDPMSSNQQVTLLPHVGTRPFWGVFKH